MIPMFQIWKCAQKIARELFPLATPILQINGAAVAAPKEDADHLVRTFADVPSDETIFARLLFPGPGGRHSL